MHYNSEKVSFQNKEGQTLDARLEVPTAEPPKTYAIFVHCFTCSKNIHAATRVARALTETGIAVLRFDFTGIGNSDGDFSNTNFSTNVSDLICAYEHLKENFGTPELLIGHSLGGAAVLAAKSSMPEIKAVVTINAPSDTQHVEKLFGEKLEKIEAQGQAEVKLGGQSFVIKKQFLEDVRSINLENKITQLNSALLVFHSPQDSVVSSKHARKIYDAAPDPKSLLALEGASHLLNKKEDSDYVANIISIWCQRYLLVDL